MTRDEKKAKDRWEYVSDRLCNSDYPIYNEEHELDSAFDAGVAWADAHPNWISVDNALPKDDSLVLIITHSGSQSVGFYNDGWWMASVNISRMGSVTHWMPLPAPPKKGE